MSKKVPDRMPASTVTDAKELKFCMQGESKVKEDARIQKLLKASGDMPSMFKRNNLKDSDFRNFNIEVGSIKEKGQKRYGKMFSQLPRVGPEIEMCATVYDSPAKHLQIPSLTSPQTICSKADTTMSEVDGVVVVLPFWCIHFVCIKCFSNRFNDATDSQLRLLFMGCCFFYYFYMNSKKRSLAYLKVVTFGLTVVEVLWT